MPPSTSPDTACKESSFCAHFTQLNLVLKKRDKIKFEFDTQARRSLVGCTNDLCYSGYQGSRPSTPSVSRLLPEKADSREGAGHIFEAFIQQIYPQIRKT